MAGVERRRRQRGQANRRVRGEGRPETFDFLGFTHYCARDRGGGFQLGRKPIAKRVSRTLRRIKEELRRRRHRGVNETGQWLGQVLNGWLNYFAVPTSFRYLGPCVREERSTDIRRCKSPIRN